ncbi:MAG: hypothetical protein U9N62_11550 [Thermotogota bacterium]|nr:hypothetical protein [Thermotogota bacterium]
MSVLNRSYNFLETKEETTQFQVLPEQIWKENAIVRNLSVLATRELMIKVFEFTEDMLKKILGENIIAAVVSSKIKHFGITPLSMRVTIKLKIISVEGNHIHFGFEAYDEMEHIAHGEIDRVIISPEYIKRKVEEKRL